MGCDWLNSNIYWMGDEIGFLQDQSSIKSDGFLTIKVHRNIDSTGYVATRIFSNEEPMNVVNVGDVSL
eukprot:snap_masked-scaffold_37-processed-gene-0.7-mRNA-1 protein AED:1.00 eAED:1.00 QI:0/-1/0/0/-1/1/1/0/67